MIKTFLATAALVLASVSGPAWAAKARAKPLAEVHLRYETHLHFRGEQSLFMTDRELYVNGSKISVPDRIVKHDFIVRALANKKSGLKGRCDAGTFSHSVRIRGKLAVENGCLNSPRFAEVYYSFQQLKFSAP